MGPKFDHHTATLWTRLYMVAANGRPATADDMGRRRDTPVNSTPPPKGTGPDDASTGGADQRLAHAHEQIKRADEVLARLTEQVDKMERDAAQPPAAVTAAAPSPSPGSASQSPSPEPAPQSFSAPPAPQPPPGRLTLRTLVALPLAACVIIAALVLQSSYGDGARRGAPQLASTPSAPAEILPAPSAVQVAAAETAPPQASPRQASPPQAPPLLAQAAAPQDAPPAATTAPLDQAQLLQTIARDLANLERAIEQLKANQQQMASENSKAIEELKASQQEMKRALAKASDAKASEPTPPKVSAPATQPAPTYRKPERPPTRARARPRYQREWMYDDDW